MYGRVDTKEILGYVRSYNNVDQRISGYVAVFDAMQRNDNLNNSAVFKLAYYVKEVMEMKNYSDVNQEDRSDLEELISKLPESVKNVVFSSQVCIKNVGYGEYLHIPPLKGQQAFILHTETHKGFPHVKDLWKIELDDDNYRLKHVRLGKYLHSFNVRKLGVNLLNMEDIVGDSVGVWKFEADGDNVYMMDVHSGQYLCATASVHGTYVRRVRPCSKDSQDQDIGEDRWKVEDCGSTRHDDVVKSLEAKPSRERGGCKRRHHHGDPNRHYNHLSRKPLAIDSSNQPEIAASSGTRPSSWINDLFGWVKSSIGGLLGSRAALLGESLKENISNTGRYFSWIKGYEGRFFGSQAALPQKLVNSTARSLPNTSHHSETVKSINSFPISENIALAACIADALDNTVSKQYQNLTSKGVEVIPSVGVAVRFALERFDSFVEEKIRNLGSEEQARIHAELDGAYPEIVASLRRGIEFSGNVGLDDVLEKCKKCFCTNVLLKDKVSTCLSDIGVTKLGSNLNR